MFLCKKNFGSKNFEQMIANIETNMSSLLISSYTTYIFMLK